MEILQVLMYVVVVHWTIVSIYTILGILGYIFYKETMKSAKNYKNTEICIVTKASKSVEGVLFECIRHNSTKFLKYIVNIIVDEGSELLPEIEDYIKGFRNTKLIIVPKTI